MSEKFTTSSGLESDKPYDNTYPQVYGKPPPKKVVFAGSNADIISEGRGFMAAFDYTMQIQVGCPGGCLFCYVPAGGMLTPMDMKRNWGFEVRNKRNVERKFRKHLNQKALADKTLYWSGVTDPYAANPAVTQNI